LASAEAAVHAELPIGAEGSREDFAVLVVLAHDERVTTSRIVAFACRDRGDVDSEL
jgi:hypothetical protein